MSTDSSPLSSEPPPRGEARKLEGGPLARKMRAALAPRIEAFRRKAGRSPSLAILANDDNPVTGSYIRSKLKACRAAGIDAAVHGLGAAQSGVLSLLEGLSRDDSVDGIILVRPFPHDADPRRVAEAIPPGKDAEGMNPVNFGEVFLARTYQEASAGILPCTAFATIELLRCAEVPVAGAAAVVVGRSNILGKPTAHLLNTLDATVTLCHSRTARLESHLAAADIVVACLGRPRFIRGAWLKKGAVVLDAGINSVDGRICGDVEFESSSQVASIITPVPGGIGPVTTAVLLSNVARLAERRLG
ncbi:MAG: bifunctional 5,10-methylenetetrahydrofolate dehydrogenase/5,10-methenyltetrahydrofolate cyclohydrolase [Elusimicrobia bacterium]|nr:bifunctional 5,10-methylenetetrahydrofolate dehydrogenase/5,10-methenyltetrahydrofolate cyclohydrolase [Elusimicrobiota bacterium]